MQSDGAKAQLRRHRIDRFVAMCFVPFGSHSYFYSVRQGTLPFMSWRLLDALFNDDQVLHTPVDDLESFLWVLVWSLVYILAPKIKDEDSKTQRILTKLSSLLSSRHIPDILFREEYVKKRWRDKVFGDLLREWLEIVRNSRSVVDRLQEAFLGSLDDDDAQESNWDDIEDCCRETYKKLLQAGYRHLRSIREFSDWEAVVDFSGEPL
jgi:hypothetical protein